MNKNFKKRLLYCFFSLFIHKISSKHNRDTTASKLNSHITRITFAKMSANSIQFLLSGSIFGQFSIRSERILIENNMFYWFFYTFNMRILNGYLQYKFTAQRVTDVSFFEVTVSRSRAVVSGFHNVRFGRVLNQFPTQYSLVSPFESLLGFREFFPRLSAIFLSGRGNSEVKLREVVYEVRLVSYI